MISLISHGKHHMPNYFHIKLSIRILNQLLYFNSVAFCFESLRNIVESRNAGNRILIKIISTTTISIPTNTNTKNKNNKNDSSEIIILNLLSIIWSMQNDTISRLPKLIINWIIHWVYFSVKSNMYVFVCVRVNMQHAYFFFTFKRLSVLNYNYKFNKIEKINNKMNWKKKKKDFVSNKNHPLLVWNRYKLFDIYNIFFSASFLALSASHSFLWIRLRCLYIFVRHINSSSQYVPSGDFNKVQF